MAVTRIILWLGNSFVFCAALFAITAAMALPAGDFQAAIAMGGLTILSGLIGTILIATTYNTATRETNADAIIFLCLFWVLIPLLGALPYRLLGASPDIFTAYFESVSAFTTTGASTLDADSQRTTILFWRSILQFAGGISSATFAVVILAALNLSGTGVHRSLLFTHKKGELFTRLIGIGRLVAGIYLFIAAAGYIFLVLGGAGPFDALCLALSGVATGGLAPRSGPLSLYLSSFSITVFAIICTFGAMNVAVIWDVLRIRNLRNIRRILANVEHRALFGMAFVLTIIGLFYAGLSNLFPLIVDSLFFVSTAGYQSSVISLDVIPSVVLVCLALIGGSALSTAGGVKMIRMLLLMRHLGTELSRLSHPSRILPVTFKSANIPDRAFLSIWMYFFAYTLCFGVGISALGAAGMPLTDSMTVSAASLSNMGPLLPLTLPESGLTYALFTPLQMGISAILMILGRVEILAAIILLTPGFWRNR